MHCLAQVFCVCVCVCLRTSKSGQLHTFARHCVVLLRVKLVQASSFGCGVIYTHKHTHTLDTRHSARRMQQAQLIMRENTNINSSAKRLGACCCSCRCSCRCCGCLSLASSADIICRLTLCLLLGAPQHIS